jgi:hypothetical protein
VVYSGLDNVAVGIPFDPWVASEAKSASHIMLRSIDPADGTAVTSIFAWTDSQTCTASCLAGISSDLAPARFR